jgi:hypothetical protein
MRNEPRTPATEICAGAGEGFGTAAANFSMFARREATSADDFINKAIGKLVCSDTTERHDSYSLAPSNCRQG